MIEIDVLIDFNELDPGGSVMTRTRRAAREFAPGEAVVVGDGDGMLAKAHVTKVSTPGWIGIQLDGPAWIGEGHFAAASLYV